MFEYFEIRCKICHLLLSARWRWRWRDFQIICASQKLQLQRRRSVHFRSGAVQLSNRKLKRRRLLTRIRSFSSSRRIERLFVTTSQSFGNFTYFSEPVFGVGVVRILQQDRDSKKGRRHLKDVSPLRLVAGAPFDLRSFKIDTVFRLRQTSGLHRRKCFRIFEEEEECVGENNVWIRPVFSMFFAVLQKLRLVKRTLKKQI